MARQTKPLTNIEISAINVNIYNKLGKILQVLFRTKLTPWQE